MGELHVFLFPLLAPGHMIPTLDMAKLFSSRGVKTTIVTTPYHAPMFIQAIQVIKVLGNAIEVRVIEFPTAKAGLPEGCQSLGQISSDDLIPNFFRATAMLQEPLEQLLKECRPHCLVADMFFPWATRVAAKFGIPRLVFHGSSYFALCASENMRRYKPVKNVSSDSEPFLVPELPHQIKLIGTQVADYDRYEIQNDFTELLNQIWDSEKTSHGVLVNSFYELEPDYAEYYRKELGRKSWHIGPLLLCNRTAEEKAQRGKRSFIDEHECLKWINSKKPNSVVYLCFGSLCDFAASQLYEIAKGLEASGQQFIWAVRKPEDDEEGIKEWLPEGYEERMKDKGLIVRGWTPQVLILEHEAIGAFVTHCGWNSILEGVCAGVSRVTWPLFAEQFFNEKLVTEILRIGVAVGSQKWCRIKNNGVTSESIAKAVRGIMTGEEALEMRNRALALKEMARKAIEERGSSYSDLSALLEELRSYHSQ